MCLIYSEGCYYLIAYNEKHDSFPSYRVDRMQGLRITDEAAVRNERIATFDAAAYTSRTFSMFGGETTPATLLVEESVMSAIIDRFGKDCLLYTSGIVRGGRPAPLARAVYDGTL